MNELVHAVCRMLPRVTEEGAVHESVAEAAIADRVSNDSESLKSVAGTIALVRQLLRAANCLDETELQAGRWRFVSFPASLFARSLLECLAAERPRVLDSGFWDASEFRISAQRDLLRKLEAARLESPGPVRPIRRVWVAWAALACDGAFLLVKREDSKRARPGNIGEFVLPGGRTSPGDLSSSSPEDQLRFFDPYVRIADLGDVDPTLERTLRRELIEELGLDTGSIRAIRPSGPRIAHTELEGANSAHAITEYFIQVFNVELYPAGEEKLLRRLALVANQFAWFTRPELIAQKNQHDQSAFVKALVEMPVSERDGILDAGICDLLLGGAVSGAANSEELQVPFLSGKTMSVGKKGRERQVVHDMDDAECALVSFLAGVRRGHNVSGLHPAAQVVPHLGWVVIDDAGLLERLRSLNARLAVALGQRQVPMSAPWTPLAFAGNAVRLNVPDSADVYFAPEAFCLFIRDEVPGKSFHLRLERRAIRSELGVVDMETREEVLPFILGTTLSELALGKTAFALDNLESWKRDQREIRIKDALGLKLFVRVVDGKPKLCVHDARVLTESGSAHGADARGL